MIFYRYCLVVTVLSALSGIMPQSLNAQNLIPNPSFEDVNTCCRYRVRCCPEGWRFVRNRSGFFIKDVEKSAYAGKNFTEISLTNVVDSARDYIQARLLCPLEKGRWYRFSMYVKPGDYAMNHIDVSFEPEMLCMKKRDKYGREDTLILKQPDIQFRDNKGLIYDRKHFLTRKSRWIKLQSTFQAKGDEHYIVIGNFLPDEALQGKRIERLRKLIPEANYWIDSLMLKPLKGNVSCDLDTAVKAVYRNNIRHYCKSGGCHKIKDQETRKTGEQDTVNNMADKTLSYDTLVFDDIHFETDKSVIPETFYASLDTVIAYYHKHEVTLLKIHGHADERGTKAYNKQLSLERAKAVKAYLVKQGLDEAAIECKGFGSERPEKGQKDYRENRRVEFIFIRKLSVR